MVPPRRLPKDFLSGQPRRRLGSGGGTRWTDPRGEACQWTEEDLPRPGRKEGDLTEEDRRGLTEEDRRRLDGRVCRRGEFHQMVAEKWIVAELHSSGSSRTAVLPLVEATAVDCGARRNDDDVACEACNVSMLSGGRRRRPSFVELCGPAVASDGVTRL
ncbi:hypothetical protein TNCT_380861 [Trichonephila clavata]|uniref:Uncharacterized protein n=2 Tax=Trichonephila clavata TaxID=2740835 RepID=A0A8X6HHK4_TRICU|nr:hypothetical protein TNCT_380861 [Trichonephila clavata]